MATANALKRKHPENEFYLPPAVLGIFKLHFKGLDEIIFVSLSLQWYLIIVFGGLL